MTGHADLIREARWYRNPNMRASMPNGQKDWGPACAFCAGDEYRTDGYCSHECRDLHEHVLQILDLADALEAAEKERDGVSLALEGERHCHRKDNEYLLERAERAEKERDEALAENELMEWERDGAQAIVSPKRGHLLDYQRRLLRELREARAGRKRCVCYRRLDTPEPPGAGSEVIGP